MARGASSRGRGKPLQPPDAVSEGNAGRPSLVDGAEMALRNWLAPGRYRSGDRLPPEHEGAAMLGISRGTLRSALGRLEGGPARVGRAPGAPGAVLVGGPAPRPGADDAGPADRAPGRRRRGRRCPR